MINFIKYQLVYGVISLLVIGVGVFSILTNGLDYAIDFTGGSIIEYQLEEELSDTDIRQEFTERSVEIESLTLDDKTRLSMRTSPVDENTESDIRQALGAELLRFETVGPSLGRETVDKTITASIVAIIGIMIYITFTFKRWTYGLAAIIAMLHDFLVLFGMYSLLSHFGAEVDALFITAVLTTMSLSVHDTIVVFDKVREYRKTSALSLDILANKALTETMVRSLNNSLTIVLMLVPLVFFGGDTLKFFAAALLIGTITGTYSSPFVATPILVFLERIKTRK